MYNRPIILFPLALLAILALLTLWIERTVQPPVHKPDGSTRHDPDYMLNNFVTTKYDINGNVRYILRASEMRHFPDNDTTELTNPDLIQFGVNAPDTTIKAKRGLVSSNGENVKFLDDVKVVRKAYGERSEMTLLTEFLNVTPEKEIATTDRPVIIQQAPETVTHATGMIYDNKQQTIKLLKNVTVHYVRPKPAVRTGPQKNSGASRKASPANITAGKKPAQRQKSAPN